jgi:hypothetical protein
MSTAPRSADPLNEPIHGPVPEGRPPWRDNAYVCFWDPAQAVFGVLHLSTSPNSEGRRARFSLNVGGVPIEIVETPHAAEAWTSASISYPLDDTIRVEHPSVGAKLTLSPRFTYADYSTSEVIPPLVPGEPQQHFQQVIGVSGEVRVGDRVIELSANGFRDRTWGYRDESAHIVEYLSFMAVFEDFGFTALRFLDIEGGNRIEGFCLSETSVTRVSQVGATRDGAGLLAAVHLEIDGTPFEAEVTAKLGGFWVPMGPVRRGPTLSAYDELVELTTPDGRVGHAFVEHAGIRRIY